MGEQTSFQKLKSAFSAKHSELKNQIVEKHKDALSVLRTYPVNITAGMLGGIMLFTNPLPVVQAKTVLPVVEQNKIIISPKEFLVSDLRGVLPKEVDPLTNQQEKDISEILSRSFHMKISAELDGIKLNRSYGLIGQEQHLARYPGDSMATHFNNGDDAEKYGSEGMAPGLGAWGYFAPSRFDLTDKDIEREKYYIAVQTFLAPGFDENVRRYIEFFKYRKMLVVNPENGKSIIVDIADAGPGESTGKHLGGSPEVMKYLERVDGAQRGPVLYFFVDDPTDQIPLGPVTPSGN